MVKGKAKRMSKYSAVLKSLVKENVSYWLINQVGKKGTYKQESIIQVLFG